MRRMTLAIGVLLLTFAGSMALQGQEAGSGEEEEPAKKAPLVIPDADKNRENPYHGSAPSIEHGKSIFLTQCAMCHGPGGDGHGDLVDRLKLQVPDFTDPATQKKRTDGELFFIITSGHDEMPGDGVRMPEEWRWDLVNYIRALARPKA